MFQEALFELDPCAAGTGLVASGFGHVYLFRSEGAAKPVRAGVWAGLLPDEHALARLKRRHGQALSLGHGSDLQPHVTTRPP
jgi:hypothetical protein